VPISRELFAVAEPIVVQAPYRTMERNKFNSWRGIYGHSGVTKYQVVSSLPITDPARLRRAGADYAGIGSAFLQRITSTARVGDLARRITQGIHNPYEKVVAIQRYLGEQYTYDLNAPPAPGGADAVDYFLFNSRVGYCDVFASAMVVMCREVGIPARLATGFSSGVYDPQFDLFRVRDMDRHAWAEVYFPGCGWVTFDPTELTHGQSQSWLRHIVLSLRRAAGELFGGPTALPMTILLLVICAAIAFGSELRSIRISRRMDGPSRLHAAAVARYAAIRRSLHVDGAHLTPIEAVSTAALGSPEAARIALEAANLFCRVRYGYSGVIPDDIQRLDRLHTELKAALRHARRLSSKAH
jgi:hypothetical protein